MEHRFNLASDPWIPVYDKNLDQKLVSLRDLLAHSDIYRIDLSDIALMRFIAAAHWTVRYREGAGLPIGKRLPAAWVDDYLDRWHDRFDLEADPTPHDHTDRDAYDQHDRNDGGDDESGLVLLPFGRVGDGRHCRCDTHDCSLFCYMAFSTAILRDLNILYIVKPSPSVGEGFTIRKT